MTSTALPLGYPGHKVMENIKKGLGSKVCDNMEQIPLIQADSSAHSNKPFDSMKDREFINPTTIRFLQTLHHAISTHKKNCKLPLKEGILHDTYSTFKSKTNT
jgi:hypothetical protein